MILFPNCKINLGLDIIGRRADGFHDIETLMLPVEGLADILEIVPSGADGGVEFSASGLAVDCADADNLCVRACDLMAGRYPQVRGVRMHLHKIVPFGAGLGGGSADAAYVIRGLDRLFDLGLEDGRMETLAAELGSDTAFFIRNVPQMASGRGEVLEPCCVPQLRGKRLVVVKPEVSVSTAEAYAGVEPGRPGVSLRQRLEGGIGRWKDSVCNAFEPSVFARYPQIGAIKNALYAAGALYASMSGSGSAVYGIFGPDVEVAVDALGDMLVYQGVIGEC